MGLFVQAVFKFQIQNMFDYSCSESTLEEMRQIQRLTLQNLRAHSIKVAPLTDNRQMQIK